MGVLILLSILLAAYAVGNFFRISDDVLMCFVNWKSLYRLEFNWKNAYCRSIITLCLLLPFGLLLGTRLQPLWKCLAVLAGYVAAREIIGFLLRPSRLSSDWVKTLRRSLWTDFIPFFPLFFLTSAFGWCTGLDVWAALLIETTVLFAVCLYHDFKILNTEYSVFLSFLYLCGLEIVPLGIWITFLV